MIKRDTLRRLSAMTSAILVLGAFVSCGKTDDSSKSSTAETTTEAQAETTTEAEATEATTETEVDTEPAASAVNTGDIDPNTGAETQYTRLDILKKVYEFAGIVSLKGDTPTDEDYVDTAVSFEYLPESEKDTVNEKATAGWILLTIYRYATVLDDTNTERDAIDRAVQDGIIDEDEIYDVSGLTDDSLKLLFEVANDSRNHQDFGEPSASVELQDNVVDLTGKLDSSEVTFTDENTIKIPDEYYDEIPSGGVVLLPDGGSGKAYKVTGKASMGEGTILTVEPAEMQDVYSSIHYSGSVKLD